jgi:hypothetical protein
MSSSGVTVDKILIIFVILDLRVRGSPSFLDYPNVSPRAYDTIVNASEAKLVGLYNSNL